MEKYCIFHVEGGIGKNIAATAVCRAIKKYYPDRQIVVVASWPDVFLHNPNVYRIYKIGNCPYFYENYIVGKDVKIFRHEPYFAEDILLKRKHLVEAWCDILGIPCQGIKPEIYLTEREMLYTSTAVSKDGPILLVQTSGGAENLKLPYGWGRDLPPMFAQNIVSTVGSQFSKVLHIRRDNQPKLKGVQHVTNPSIRVLICHILLADKILAIDSFVQHAAAALDKPATVAWIANSPVVFGYNIHTNLLPLEEKGFRHRVDSYLEESDWTGGKMYECPYDDIGKMFDKDQFVNSLLDFKDQVFDSKILNQSILEP